MNAYGLDLGFGTSAGRAQQEEENEFLLSALGYSNSDGSENSQKGTGNDNNNSNDDDDNTSNTYVKNADSPLLSGLHSPVMQEEGRSPGSGVPSFRSIAGQAAAFRHLHEQAYQARRLQSTHALFTPSEENASPVANTLETTSGAGAATSKAGTTLSRSSSSSGPNGANIVHNHDVKSDDDNKARNTESKGSGNETRNKRKMTSSRTSGGARSKNAKNKHTPSTSAAPVGGGVQTASSSTASTVKVADSADPRRKSKYVRDKERRNQLNDALDDLHATLGIPQSARTDRVSWNG
jgi:hypothetical protein